MGVDIHIHDTYFTVGYVPFWIAAIAVAAIIGWGVLKVIERLGRPG